MADLHWHQRKARRWETGQFDSDETSPIDARDNDHEGHMLGPRPNEMLECLSRTTLDQLVSSSPPNFHVCGKGTLSQPGGKCGGLIHVSPGATLEQLFQVISQHHISCVPVLRGDEFLGTISVVDMVARLVQGLAEHKDEAQILRASASSFLDRNRQKGTPPLQRNSPGATAVLYMGSGVHQVPLLGQNNTVDGMCSQSDAVAFLSTQFDSGVAVGMGARSILQYKDVIGGPWGGPWGADAVVKVTRSDTMKKVLSMVASTGLTALAVTSGDRLIGHLSAMWQLPLLVPLHGESILRHWKDASVGEFMDAHADVIMEPVCELPQVTLANVCRTMMDRGVHHVWIVDGLDTMRPLRCLSMTDVCRIVTSFHWPSWYR